MRRTTIFALSLLVPGLMVWMIPGCGEDSRQAAPPAPGVLDNAATRMSVSDDAAEQSQGETDPQGNADNAPDDITYHVHRHAGRSAFLLPGEELELIKPEILGNDPFANAIDPADIPAVVRWDQAERYVGYEILVQGKVVGIGNSGNVNFLNFDKDWRGKFYMVIFDDLAQTLDGTVEENFLNKTLQVRGKVEMHRRTPQIKILSMEQVEGIE